jgi:cytosine/adenosine deaminase-related metal-dependent hydrolase
MLRPYNPFKLARVQPLTIKNATVWDGTHFETRDLYTSDVVLDKPAHNAITVDLAGYTIFPGLINAHDHLELNHYPRTKFRERYDNAHQWGEDVNTRLNDEPFKSLRAYPLADRLFIGGLKNLLCGVTTVIHHNPPHRFLFSNRFPVRVLKEYTWAHSLRFSSQAEIAAAARQAAKAQCGFFIHLAEGTDEVAAQEYRQLKAIIANISDSAVCTILIHCVGMNPEDIADIGESHFLGFIWCPSTNLYLLGKTIDWEQFQYAGRVNALGLGSDSRLTADGDFLDEIRAARRLLTFDSGEKMLYNMIFLDNAFLTGIEALYGFLKADAPADLIALPKGKSLLDARRADLALVVRGGVPQIGDPDMMVRFPHIETVPAMLDGAPKAINIQLAHQIARCTLQEPGLVLEMPIRRRGG